MKSLFTLIEHSDATGVINELHVTNHFDGIGALDDFRGIVVHAFVIYLLLLLFYNLCVYTGVVMFLTPSFHLLLRYIFTYKTTVKVYKFENSYMYHHFWGSRMCYELLEIVSSNVTIILKLFIPKLRSPWNCLSQSYDHIGIVYSKVTIIISMS